LKPRLTAPFSSGSDKIEALPSLTSSKDQADGTGVVEDFQRVIIPTQNVAIEFLLTLCRPQDQNELDDAFTAAVKRSVAPFKESSGQEKPSLDVRRTP
jgi:hypothetical protein